MLRAKPYLLIADGGDATYFATCSYSAVKAALDQPRCAGVALPVRLTADGVPIVFPESSLARMTGLDLKVADLSWADISLLTFQHRIEIYPGIFAQYQQSEAPMQLADILPELAGLDFAVFLYFPHAPTWEAVKAAGKAAKLIGKYQMEAQSCIVPPIISGLFWQSIFSKHLAKGVWCESAFQQLCFHVFRLGRRIYRRKNRQQAVFVPLEAHRVWSRSANSLPWIGYHTQNLAIDNIDSYISELLELPRPFLLLNGRMTELCEQLYVNK